MKLSIVATLYKSEPHIREFHERVSAAAQKVVGDSYEIVFVNDGSPDDSLELAVKLTDLDNHVVVVDLSRNFGHHKAIMIGLGHANGERIFLIDSDLEEAPEWLCDFWEAIEKEEADVIYGRQDQRKGGWFERSSGALFYRIFDWLGNIKHPRNIVTARLMTSRYVDALLRYRESEIVISCLWVITGFKQCERMVNKTSNSPSTYSLSAKLAHAVNALTSFSAFPLVLIFYLGLFIFACAGAYASYLIAFRIFAARTVDGWTSVIVSVWLLGGLMISLIGVIGIYVAKIFSETKHRPTAIVRDIYRRSTNEY